MEQRRYIAAPDGYLVVLREGDDVYNCLEDLMRREEMASATISGFGFASLARFGFYDHSKSVFLPGDFREVEITNLTGSLAWKDGDPSVHAHATGGDRSFADLARMADALGVRQAASRYNRGD